MNILLTITIIFLTGQTNTETIGLFKATPDCVLAGQMMSSYIIDGNGVSGVSFDCTKQKES